MKNLHEIIKSAQKVLTLSGASEESVASAEASLGLSFSKEFRDYTLSYGAICIDGTELTGVVDDPDLDVVRTTISARNITPQASPDWYVVRDPHIDGIIIWQNKEGAIYQTAPGTAPKEIYDSLATYLVSLK